MSTLKNKYNRVAEDKQQLQEFVDKVCDGEIGDGNKDNRIPDIIEGDEGKLLGVEDGEYTLMDPPASTTYSPFPSTWVTNTTIAAFCASVDATESAIEGMAYLGELTCSDLPINGNLDTVVEIMSGTTIGNKAIHVICSSGTNAPYRWEYTYWNNGLSISGWIGFQPELPTTVNNKYLHTNALTGALEWSDVDGIVTVSLGNAITGTLSDDDYAKVTGDNCVIKFGNYNWYKYYDDGTYIYYCKVKPNNGYDSVTTDLFKIKKDTKFYQPSTDRLVFGNPTLSGGETQLTSLQIGQTIYDNTVDTTIVNGSTHAVSGGAVYNAINGITSGTLGMSYSSNVQSGGNLVRSITITNPDNSVDKWNIEENVEEAFTVDTSLQSVSLTITSTIFNKLKANDGRHYAIILTDSTDNNLKYELERTKVDLTNKTLIFFAETDRYKFTAKITYDGNSTYAGTLKIEDKSLVQIRLYLRSLTEEVFYWYLPKICWEQWKASANSVLSQMGITITDANFNTYIEYFLTNSSGDGNINDLLTGAINSFSNGSNYIIYDDIVLNYVSRLLFVRATQDSQAMIERILYCWQSGESTQITISPKGDMSEIKIELVSTEFMGDILETRGDPTA